MKYHLFRFLAAFYFLSLAPQMQAQSIDSTLARYSRDFAPEKLHLQFDKASYHPGETIWFKAYIMEGLYPSENSKTLYVDWIAPNGDVVFHSVSPVVDGGTNGQVALPEGYDGSFILVRAYTKWMLNFDTAFLYTKDIRIHSRKGAAAAKPAALTQLQFFPESGEAVAGLQNTIAFKSTDQWGRPVSLRGAILDGGGKIIDSFRTTHNGMGSLQLIPQGGTGYTARWKDSRGLEGSMALPAARPSGVTMRVAIAGAQRHILLAGTGDIPAQLQQLHIVGTLHQQVAFKTDVTLAPGGQARRIIPVGELPSGILTITLFDASWNAIGERITFVNNGEYSFQPNVEVKHWGLGKRARNEVEIALPPALSGAQLSVSVTDLSIESDSSNHIISQLLLGSELKGYVYNPSYYFSQGGEKIAEELDLVMLTNGWRRFKWEDVTAGRLPAITYPKEKQHLSLSGKVYGVPKSLLSGKESILVMLKEKDSGTRMVLMPIQTDGNFADPGIIFFDTLKVYYQLKSKLFGQAEARFMTERLSTPNYKTYSRGIVNRSFFYDTTGQYYHALMAAQAAKLRETERGRMLENVTVTTRAKPTEKSLDEKYATGIFSMGDGYQFDMVNNTGVLGYTNVFQYLQGRVPGLQVQMSGGTTTLGWRGGQPLIYLDHMPVDAELINTLPVSDIAYIKVFRPPFMGGTGGGNGAIAIFTRRGDDVQSRPGTGLSNNTITGYTPVREFYSPNYAQFDKRHESQDLRTTIYWNPFVELTPTKKSVKLTFYNNDVTKAFRVTIEGVTRDGLLTHYEYIME